MRGSWGPNITEIFWPRSYGGQRCVFLVLHGCSTEPWSKLFCVLAFPTTRVYFRLPLYCLPSFSPISHCPQFVGLILPSNSHAVIQTRLNAYATSSDFQRPGCVTSFRCTTLNGIFGRVKRSKHNTDGCEVMLSGWHKINRVWSISCI